MSRDLSYNPTLASGSRFAWEPEPTTFIQTYSNPINVATTQNRNNGWTYNGGGFTIGAASTVAPFTSASLGTPIRVEANGQSVDTSNYTVVSSTLPPGSPGSNVPAFTTTSLTSQDFLATFGSNPITSGGGTLRIYRSVISQVVIPQDTRYRLVYNRFASAGSRFSWTRGSSIPTNRDILTYNLIAVTGATRTWTNTSPFGVSSNRAGYNGLLGEIAFGSSPLTGPSFAHSDFSNLNQYISSVTLTRSGGGLSTVSLSGPIRGSRNAAYIVSTSQMRTTFGTATNNSNQITWSLTNPTLSPGSFTWRRTA